MAAVASDAPTRGQALRQLLRRRTVLIGIVNAEAVIWVVRRRQVITKGNYPLRKGVRVRRARAGLQRGHDCSNALSGLTQRKYAFAGWL